MLSITPTGSSATVRFWAVLALLFVLGTQVLESAHTHTASDTATHCILCQGTASTAAITSTTALPIFIATGTLLFFLGSQIYCKPVFTSQQPRGPPRKS